MGDTITESQFLLTELRYTLGQLHVQVLDLDANMRNKQCEGRSIESILSEMLSSESDYQKRYAELLGISGSIRAEIDTSVPLPVNEAQENPSAEGTFEHERARTIGLLERAGDNWSRELLDLVKQQVADDRRRTTEIADCRRASFLAETRPDLSEPLTKPAD